jgi:hypothetical protein
MGKAYLLGGSSLSFSHPLGSNQAKTSKYLKKFSYKKNQKNRKIPSTLLIHCILSNMLSLINSFSRYVPNLHTTCAVKGVHHLNPGKKTLFRFRNFLLKSCSATARALHTSNPVCITSTPVLFAEPLKKKKKLDPQVIKHREERKRKKLEKQIRRLERNARQLKPIEELEVPLTLLDEKKYIISLSI